MKLKILEGIRVIVPDEDSNDIRSIKFFAIEVDNGWIARMGIGSDQWVHKNGDLVPKDFAKKIFPKIKTPYIDIQ